jgi:hypothetical protein
MAAKQSELSKLLKKIERKLEKHARDPWYTDGDFFDLDDYTSYLKKELKLTKKSDLYIIDMEKHDYMDFFFETLMHYVGKDVSIQVNKTWTNTCDGEFYLIVLVALSGSSPDLPGLEPDVLGIIHHKAVVGRGIEPPG